MLWWKNELIQDEKMKEGTGRHDVGRTVEVIENMIPDKIEWWKRMYVDNFD